MYYACMILCIMRVYHLFIHHSSLRFLFQVLAKRAETKRVRPGPWRVLVLPIAPVIPLWNNGCISALCHFGAVSFRHCVHEGLA